MLTRRAILLASTALAAPCRADGDIERFVLPPKSVFDRSMPRYPNLWFLIDERLAASHGQAVRKVTGALKNTLRLPEYYPPFDNPEGCDFEVRMEHLQPWIERERRALQHGHSFHMRYYYRALAPPALARIALGGRSFHRFAASVHYEVEHANPNHADVEECPICGRTGQYAQAKGNLVEQVHDPLGLELILHGTIRGQAVQCEDWQRTPFGGISRLEKVFRISVHEFAGMQADRNTARLGAVVFGPAGRG